MPKEVKTEWDARESVARGIKKAVEYVSPTLGAIGKTVLVGNHPFDPIATDDGITVLKNLEFRDKFEEIGLKMIRKAASSTNESAGDGTTTSAVLAGALITKSFDVIGKDSSRVGEIKESLADALDLVRRELSVLAKPVTNDNLEQIATISSLDPEVGQLIAEAMIELGDDGVLTVQEGTKIGVEKEVVKGMRLERGFLAPQMMTNPERNEAVLEDPLIWLTDRRITANSHVQKVLEALHASGKQELLVIADEVAGEALASMVINTMKGIFRIVCIQIPDHGVPKKDVLADIAALTGATVISEEAGLKLDDTRLDQLGSAARIVSTRTHTTIIEGRGDAGELESRLAQLRSLLETTESAFDVGNLKKRIAQLSGGVGVIKVGSFTENETRTKKFKIEDALNATQAAREEGVVIGGGAALAKIAHKLDERSGDGFKIVSAALKAPLRQMAVNAGLDPDKILKQVISADQYTGYDFHANELKDLMSAGVLDPVKVTRLALENAASITNTILTTEVAIVDDSDPEPAS